MIVFDVEIKRAIPPRKGELPLPEGIEVCGGWRDFAGMGIACVCTYDTDTGLSRVFLGEDPVDFLEYIADKPTAGFNTRRFDIPLLRENGYWVGNEAAKHYDMLEEIWIALRLNPDKFYPKTHGGCGLDAVCQATLGIAKTGHGALAPVWWQQGKMGKVIDYCLNDVWMEAQLLLHIIEKGWVRRDPQDYPLQIKRPQGFRSEPITSAEYRSRLDAIAIRDGGPELEVEVKADQPLPSGLGIIR